MEKEQLVSLVTKAQQGDNEALNCLFNEFYNDLYYFALKTVKDDETALDVTQESFVEIINTLGNLKEPAAFVTWAKQITYHQCTRYFKKKKDVLVDEDEEGNTVFDTLKEEKAEFIPDEALDKADFKKTVMGILDELSEEQRSAVMMYYFDEMSVKQIAEIQGVSEGTVKSRLNYARKAIKNSVEEYEKKHNIKLHAIPFFPFLKWIFDGMFEGSLPTASAEIIAEGVGAATGTTVTVATTTATATTVATTSTAGAVGLGAKIAAMPIVTKVIAGVVAAAIVIGGGTTAVLLSQKDNTPTSADSHIDYSYRTEYMTSWNYEQALNYYHGWLNDFDMPYFNSVDEVSVDVAVRFGYGEWAGTYQGEWDMDSIIGDQKALLKALFGREFDFTKLTGEYATYNAEKGIVTVNKNTIDIYNADSWRSDTGKPIDNGDGTYSIIIRDYRNKVNKLPDDIKDGEYVVDEENGGYFTLTHSGRLTIEKKDGFWVLKSYTKTDLQSGDGSSSETTTSEGSSSNNNDNTTDTSKPSTPSTSTSTTTPTTSTINYMTADKIENTNWTYTTFSNEISNYILNNFESSSMGLDSANGKYYGEWYLCEEDTFSNFNIMGYKCYDDSLGSYIGVDQSKVSYIGAGYQMALDTGEKTKASFDVLNRYYEFACETESFAIECIERDINKLCEFSGISQSEIKETNYSLNQSTYSDVVKGKKSLNITFFNELVGQNELSMSGNDYNGVSASISCETRDGILYYMLTVTIN